MPGRIKACFEIRIESFRNARNSVGVDGGQLLITGRLIAISHICLLCGLVLLRLRSWDRLYAGMIGLGAASSVALPLALQWNSPLWLRLALAIPQIGLTFWFWLYALAVRSPEFRPGILHWSVLPAKIFVTILWAGTQSQSELSLLALSDEERVLWRSLVPALFSMGLTAAAVYVAGRGLEDELDSTARRVRQLLVYWGAAAITATFLIVSVLRGERLDTIAAWLVIGLAMAICVSVHVLVLRSAPLALSAAPAEYRRHSPETADDREGPGAAPTETELALAQRIESCLREEEYFRTEGLTVSMLASHLHEKDYKIRRTINQVLGYRNFNVFLNEIRIAVARQLLREEPELPVIRLALDLGYRSLAGFNKAFKTDTGQTPTEFRRHSLATATTNRQDSAPETPGSRLSDS